MCFFGRHEQLNWSIDIYSCQQFPNRGIIIFGPNLYLAREKKIVFILENLNTIRIANLPQRQHNLRGGEGGKGALYVQMGFTRTCQTNTK